MTTTTAGRTAAARPPTTGADIAIGLGVLGVLCLTLIPVEIDSAFGLPAHPLLLHVPVVLVPLLAIGLLVSAARPDFFLRNAIGIGALTIASLASTILTVGAGDSFREKLITGGEVRGDELHRLSEHAESGETLRIVVILLAAVVLFAVGLSQAHPGSRLNRLAGLASSRQVWIGLRVLFAIGAVVATFFVIRTGHLGAELTWKD
jgi:hypothetical protein